MPIIYTTTVATNEADAYVDFVIRLDSASLSNGTVSYQTVNDTALFNSNSVYVHQAGTLAQRHDWQQRRPTGCRALHHG